MRAWHVAAAFAAGIVAGLAGVVVLAIALGEQRDHRRQFDYRPW